MTPEEIAAIRQRAEREYFDVGGHDPGSWQAVRDVPVLLAEVERLHAEIERYALRVGAEVDRCVLLEAERDEWKATAHRNWLDQDEIAGERIARHLAERERDEARAALARAERERDRYRVALETAAAECVICAGSGEIRPFDGERSWPGVPCDWCAGIRAALAGREAGDQ